MRIGSVLVVCIGNICRSPLGERALSARVPGLMVKSAGLGALVGHAADSAAAAAGAEFGVSVDGHAAQQWSAEMARQFDLILVMEPEHRATITRSHPELSGKTFLFSHWSDGKPIEDPYRRSDAFHKAVAKKIIQAADGWAEKLKGMSK